MDSNTYRLKSLSLKILFQLFLRSFFFQGSFSTKYRQNVGFAFCMEPIGRFIWDDPEKLKYFFVRHMDFYNGNPFMITLVLGAVAKMEEMLYNNNEITEKILFGLKRLWDLPPVLSATVFSGAHFALLELYWDCLSLYYMDCGVYYCFFLFSIYQPLFYGGTG